MLTDFFIRNLDVVFFIYGLAFVILGITIFLQIRITKKSDFKLLDLLWLLAWFGLTHAITEFVDMFILIKGELPFLKILSTSVLFISYSFLFLFGYKLVNINRKGPGIWFPPAVALLFLGMPVIVGVASYNIWNISARYFLGFPGAFLSAAGFYLYYMSEARKLRNAAVKKHFIFISLFFVLYGISGGLIVPGSNFFPASAINYASFISWSGIPVQIFRAISAIVIAWSIWHVVNIFNIEEAVRRKRIEYELGESEERYRKLVELSPDAIAIHSEGRIAFINTAGAKILGAANTEQLIGKPIMDIVHPDCREVVRDRIRQMREEGKDVELIEEKFVRLDGSVIHAEVAAMPFAYRGKPGMQVVVRDITKRKQAEEQIHDQAALLDNANDSIAVLDLEYRIIYWNKSASRLYGFTKEEATGKNARVLYKEEASFIEACKSVIEKGEWIGELRQVMKDDGEIIVESRWTLMHDKEGKPKSILTINTDITEKKKLEAQFLRAQRMESIGTLASGLAHDINNVLSPIMMSLQLLRERYNDDESRKLINILESSAERGAGLIKQVQSFARGIEGERMTLQIAHLVSEIKQIVKEIFPRNIEIRIDIQKDLCTISGDATQLHQVLMNLCVNAKDAMPAGGVLSITASNYFIDENYARINLEAEVGSYVMIAVADTGTGIPPKITDRIFEPFFTTKEPGKGTGLGLSTALAIVKSHGGFINVYSEVGKGTIFRIYLPALKATETQKKDEQRFELLKGQLPRGQGECILVVDDETQIREITRATLEAYGYRVLTANDGMTAVTLYTQNKEEIKVVLMDMMMPVMDGSASIQELHKIDPELKIIAVSGLTENDRFANITDNVYAFLSKPYTAEKLLKTISKALSVK